jgi:hypothetical protein
MAEHNVVSVSAFSPWLCGTRCCGGQGLCGGKTSPKDKGASIFRCTFHPLPATAAVVPFHSHRATGQVGYVTLCTLYHCVYYYRPVIKLCAGRVFDGPLVQTDFRNRQTRPSAQVESTIVNVVFRDKVCLSMAFDQIVTF